MPGKARKGFIGIIIVIFIAVVIIGITVYKNSQADNNSKKTEITNQAPVVTEPKKIDLKTVEYAGVDGKNVLELLRQNAKIEFTSSDTGALIISINGIKNSDNESWFYSINGASTTVAADKHITRSGDRIKWEYKINE